VEEALEGLEEHALMVILQELMLALGWMHAAHAEHQGAVRPLTELVSLVRQHAVRHPTEEASQVRHYALECQAYLHQNY
jgi:hypothetical protein